MYVLVVLAVVIRNLERFRVCNLSIGAAGHEADIAGEGRNGGGGQGGPVPLQHPALSNSMLTLEGENDNECDNQLTW